MIKLEEGTIFSNRYRIVRLIGKGGMGAVYEVIHLETERRRALKVMSAHLVEDAEMRARFRQEAKVASRIDSEHIVDVFDAGVDDAMGVPFLVMELLHGEEIGKKLKSVGRLNSNDVVIYLYQVALALEKTHKVGIVHRDLKPDNLFLTQRENGQIHLKVLDFGIAKFLTPGISNGNATSSIGTPLYMAPEQFLGGSVVSPQADIYALGMIAYTLLVGTSYWSTELSNASNIFAFAYVAGAGPSELATRRALRSSGVVLPAAFDAWFSIATAVQPSKRFSSAMAAVMALGDALDMRVSSSYAVVSTPPGISSPPHRGSSSVDFQRGSWMGSGKGVPNSSNAIQLGAVTEAGLTSTKSKGDKSRRAMAIAIASGIALAIVSVAFFIIIPDESITVEQNPSGAASASVRVGSALHESVTSPLVLPNSSTSISPMPSVSVSPLPVSLTSTASWPAPYTKPSVGSAVRPGVPAAPKNDLIKRF